MSGYHGDDGNYANIEETDAYTAPDDYEYKEPPPVLPPPLYTSPSQEQEDDPIKIVLQKHHTCLIELLDDLNVAVFSRKTVSEQQFFDMMIHAISRQKVESDSSFIEKFVQILHSKPPADDQGDWIKTKRGVLSEHFEQFQEIACRFSELIISERHIPKSSKIVPPARLGGVAGGQKFLTR
jgi:hypothetical protein